MENPSRTVLFERVRTARAAKDPRGLALAYQELLVSEPDEVLRWGTPLGVALAALPGEARAAEQAFVDAVNAAPGDPVPWHNLATFYARQDRPGDAAGILAYVVRMEPTPARVNALVVLSEELDHRKEAIPTPALAALSQHAPRAHWLVAYAERFVMSRRFTAAHRQFARVTEMIPAFGRAWQGAGACLGQMNRPDEAIALLRQGLKLCPEHPGIMNTLGSALMRVGEHWEGRQFLRHAARVAPGWGDDVSLMMRQYDAYSTAEEIIEDHNAWGRRVYEALNCPARPPVDDPRPNRQLRVGLVGNDFGTHPVGFFLDGFLRHVDKASTALYVYCGRPEVTYDAVTRRLMAAPAIEKWANTDLVTDDTLFEMVRADKIDVLVDLAGHTAGTRLNVFARCAAPVQVTWGGYVGTTGLPVMDYLITDNNHMPEHDEAPLALMYEKCWRLPTYVCWAPPTFDIEVGPLPMLTNGYITFGCMNNLVKLSPETLVMWRRILEAIPTSKLLIKTAALSDYAKRRRVLAMLGDESRVTLEGSSPRKDLLATYNRIDVALDPHPYSGGVTTLEAMWMGVPTITLDGDRFCARHTLAHQRTVMGWNDAESWRANDEDDYVALAEEVAGDPEWTEKTRAGLRAKMLASLVCDGPAFSREWDRALRGMWTTLISK